MPNAKERASFVDVGSTLWSEQQEEKKELRAIHSSLESNRARRNGRQESVTHRFGCESVMETQYAT
jgi:hypothetical protein